MRMVYQRGGPHTSQVIHAIEMLNEGAAITFPDSNSTVEEVGGKAR
jgi:hypothetical protein